MHKQFTARQWEEINDLLTAIRNLHGVVKFAWDDQDQCKALIDALDILTYRLDFALAAGEWRDTIDRMEAKDLPF